VKGKLLYFSGLQITNYGAAKIRLARLRMIKPENFSGLILTAKPRIRLNLPETHLSQVFFIQLVTKAILAPL
jgi:hypothetical protein